MLDPTEIATRIGVPLEYWPGQCFGIACELVNCRIFNGVPRYGHWLGPVSEDCPVESFKNGLPFQRHGWIELCNSLPQGWQGEIVDPTRWVFEGKEPYIYVGPNDHYDAGGQWLCEVMERPCPAYSVTEKRVNLSIWRFSREAHEFVMQELFDGASGITVPMMFWLGNLSLNRLGRHARPVYQALEAAGQRAVIPIDNRELVLGSP